MGDVRTRHASQRQGSALVAALLAGLTVGSTPVGASQAVGWWGGQWKCEIDGRPARMSWKVVDDPQTECRGDVCSTTSGVRWAGQFSDNGSKWVPLRDANNTAQDGLSFRHADGNKWHLARPVSGKAKGWTTWNGKRYPLACWK